MKKILNVVLEPFVCFLLTLTSLDERLLQGVGIRVNIAISQQF